MMAEFRWITLSLCLMLQFRFSASAKYALMGKQVTLSCDNVIDDQHKCNRTSWNFTRPQTKELLLFEYGQIHKDAKANLDRLSVTQNCSLVITNVRAEDAGAYVCRQSKSGQKQDQDTTVFLIVIEMTEQVIGEQVTLSCSLASLKRCLPKVKWLYEGKNADENKVLKTSVSNCSASVTFPISTLKHCEFFQCEVTDTLSGVVRFPFRCQPSSENTGPDGTATTLSPTMTSKSMKMSPSVETNKTSSTNNNERKQEGLWMFVIVSAGLAALLIIIVALVRWKRIKGNQTQSGGNTRIRSGDFIHGEVMQADPQDDVCYTTIHFTKKTNSRDQVVGKDDDDDDDDDDDEAVNYSFIQFSPPADPSSLYSLVNKPNK